MWNLQVRRWAHRVTRARHEPPIDGIGTTRRTDRPTVGITGVWVNPTWQDVHGVSGSLADALERLGVYGGYREGLPIFAARLVRKWVTLTGRSGDLGSVMLTWEMRTFSRAWWMGQRLATPPSVDAWLLLSGARSVRGRYVTITDQSPSQVLRRSHPSVNLYPDASEAQIRPIERYAHVTSQTAYVSCAASQWAAASLIDDLHLAPEKVKVVGFGVGAGHDQSRVPVGLRNWSHPSFLFVGRDWDRKNGDAVIRAFRSLRQSEPTATLHVVGAHPHLSEGGVTGYGPLSRHDPNEKRTLDQLFARATCFVMPSVVEPFGHAYVEAGTVGVGSIGTTEGGAADAIGRGGVLVDPLDVCEIAEAMRYFCRPGIAPRIGLEACEHSKQLSWDLVAQRVLRALDISIPGVELAQFLRPTPVDSTTLPAVLARRS